jgi:trans-aconitate methyltransferase
MPRDWDAAAYERLSAPLTAMGTEVLDRLVLSGDETVLDAGCGSGNVTRVLHERLPRGHVIAVDAAPSMVERARELLPADVDVRQVDLLELELAEPVDAILSTATFHWVTDHERLFANLHAALKPGGRLVAQCGGGPNLEALLTRTRALMQAPRFARQFDGWTEPWEFATVLLTTSRLERAGFTAIMVSLEEAPTTLADRETYTDFVSCVCIRPHLSRLPEPERREFLAALAEQAENDTPRFTLDYWRLNIFARKPEGAEQAA